MREWSTVDTRNIGGRDRSPRRIVGPYPFRSLRAAVSPQLRRLVLPSLGSTGRRRRALPVPFRHPTRCSSISRTPTCSHLGRVATPGKRGYPTQERVPPPRLEDDAFLFAKRVEPVLLGNRPTLIRLLLRGSVFLLVIPRAYDARAVAHLVHALVDRDEHGEDDGAPDDDREDAETRGAPIEKRTGAVSRSREPRQHVDDVVVLLTRAGVGEHLFPLGDHLEVLLRDAALAVAQVAELVRVELKRQAAVLDLISVALADLVTFRAP